jgi:DNA topoisomerase I
MVTVVARPSLLFADFLFSGKPFVVVFDFLGKDSIRYYNEVPVEKRVFKNLQLFTENKAGADDLFDRLNVSSYSG